MPAPRIERIDWYETPRWYDAIFDVDTRCEADFLEALVRAHGRALGRRALEPACGSGRLVAELARRGWDVAGFDQSRAMLDFARARLARRRLAARLFEADLADFRVRGRYALAHCLVSTFKYLLDERSARAHLACVARALQPGGLYVLGLHLTDYAERADVRERWSVVKHGARVSCDTRVAPADRRARLEPVRTRLKITRRGGAVTRSETSWQFRTYDAREARALIRSCEALELVAIHDFHYEIDREVDLDDDYLDKVLVLRRR